MSLEAVEFVENPEPRCPVVLLLDTSESMEGKPIDELNAGLATFKYEVEKDPLAALRVELCIVTFGGDVACNQDFKTIDEFIAPKLSPKGLSPLGGALELGLKKLEERKHLYKKYGIPYYRPWLFLITDGAPTDGMKWYEEGKKAQQLEAEGHLSFFLIGIEGADMDILRKIASPEHPPLKMQDLRFREMFKWLSASVRRVSSSRVETEMMALPSVSGWAEANEG